MKHSVTTTANVRAHRMVIQAGDWRYHFDRTGRFLFGVRAHETVRRGLDDRVIQVRLPAEGGIIGRTYRTLDPVEKAAFYRRAYALARASLGSLPAEQAAEWKPLLERWTPEALAADAHAFRQVYLPINILPPDQYHALVVQITHGCSYNRCLFCDFYRDRRFHIKSKDELQIHLDRLQRFMGPRIADRSGVFLGDGNAFVVPTDKLLSMMELVREQLGSSVSEDFYTFMDTFTLEHKTPEDLRRIYEQGLRTVYTGLETGSNRLRAFLRKPGTAEEAVAAINRLKEAGYRIGVILMVGVGGPKFAREHLAATRQALNGIHFTPGDLVYLSPFVDPHDTDYDEQARAHALSAFLDEQMEEELARWRRALASLPAKVTLYSIREHLYA
ncbi:radical SAM protein [Alicyclobacillus shizuokensis]|uniref:radical SAM protein n=1 Tax=Alicyclobacillus shizuokensis TaxID=392014 RepID=UPI00082D8FAE|nr:radical SAM protein [Alicyclobacillus shizuokensis]